MSYTKRNLNSITFLITIFIFICLYFINLQINSFFDFQKNSSQIYSKTIPLNEFEQIKNTQKQDRVNTIKMQAELQPISMNLKFQQQFLGTTSDSVKKEINSSSFKETNSISSLEQSIIEAKKENEKIGNKTQRQVINENKKNSWRIEIPKLNVNVHIAEGTTSSVLLQAVGHFEESSKWNGNVCLAAHNRGYNCNFFQKIKNLKIGDEIIYYTTKGKKIYKVQTNKTILETDWSYLEKTNDNRITLITCEENRREYRRCVQAIEISEEGL